MKRNKSNMVFRLDVNDFNTKNEILGSIKKILELMENKDLVDSFNSDNHQEYKVNLKKGISFIITDCKC